MLTNVDMEASVLGTILYNNDYLYKVMDILRDDCFSEGLHRDIYIYAKMLINEGEQVSPFRLYNRFAKELGVANKDYLSGITALAKPLTLKTDVKHLSDLAHRRAISALCASMLSSVEDFTKTGIERAGELLNQATRIVTESLNNNSIGIVEAMAALVNEMMEPTPVYQAKTGIKILDKGTNGGLQKGRMYAIMAAAKVGKTMLATTLSNNLNDEGHKHVFICAEMGSKEICQRMLGHRMNSSMDIFMSKNKEIINKATETIGYIKRNVIFEDAPGIELENLKSVIEMHVHKNKIEGFILDYYQLVGGCEKNTTQAQHLEDVANWAHRACKRHNIWCVLLVQTNDDQKVLGSRGLNRACDQGYLIERHLDEKGDPLSSDAWLKLRFSRYTRTYNFGDKDNPSLRVSEHGTHFEEVDRYGFVVNSKYNI